MKVNSTLALFQPFDVILRIEDEEDARAMYAVFSHIKNTELFDDSESNAIREVLRPHVKMDVLGVISRGVRYRDFFTLGTRS